MQIVQFNSLMADEWYQSEFGQKIMAYECAQLANFLPKYPAHNLLQVGGNLSMQHAKVSTAKHKFCFAVSDQLANLKLLNGAIVDLQDMPLVPGSVDVMLLIHVLEYTEHPTLLLKQVHDSLAEGGKLIIIGFNPWSWWGIKSLAHRRQDFPWQARFWMRSKLSHWLSVLGFAVSVNNTFCFKPPTQKNVNFKTNSFIEIFGQLCCPAWGGIHLMVAEKKVHIPLLQRALNWRKNSLLTTRMIEPTTRTQVLTDEKWK